MSSSHIVNSDPRCQDIPLFMYSSDGNITLDNATIEDFNNKIQAVAISPLKPVNKDYFDLQLALLVLGIWHLIISTAIYTYMYFAKSDNPSVTLFIRIKKRKLGLYYLNTLITALFLATAQVMKIIWTPCWLTHMLNSFLSPLIGVYVMAKTVDFFNRSSLHRLIKEANVADSSSDSSNEKPKRTFLGDIKLALFPPPDTANGIENKNKINEEDEGDNHSEAVDHHTKTLSKDTIRFVKFMLSPKARHTVLLIVFAPYAAFTIGSLAYLRFLSPEANCYGCDELQGQLLIALSYAAATVIIGLIVAFRSRDFPDNFGMMRENLYFALAGTITITAICILFFVEMDERSSNFFVFLYWFGYDMMHFVASTLQIIFAIQEEDNPNVFTKMQKIFGRVDPRRRRGGRRARGKTSERRETDFSTITDLSTNVTTKQKPKPGEEMRNLLENKLGSSDYVNFERYLAGEFATENIKMYEECSNWKRNYFDLNATTARSRAKRIVNLYVKTDSVFYVNLPATMREKLEKSVNDTTIDLEIQLFDEAQKEMFNILEGAYMRYKKKNKGNKASR